eukprot:scaffold682_cov363-Pavlova_lutheri.AAC.44
MAIEWGCCSLHILHRTGIHRRTTGLFQTAISATALSRVDSSWVVGVELWNPRPRRTADKTNKEST